MNYFDIERKLIEAKLSLINLKRTTEVLNKLDSLSERIESVLPERLSVTMKVEELLSSDEPSLPLRIRGALLGVGRHKRRYYTEEELRKAVQLHGDRIIPLRLDHKREGVMHIVGAITRLYWDEDRKEVMYEGHINDERYARNVLDRVITDVSGSMGATERYDPVYGVVGEDIEFIEVSLVDNGAYSNNTLEAVI